MQKSFFLLLFLLSPFICFAEKSTLSVGVSLPLTGAWAEFGDAVRKGIELAQNDHPDLFSNVKFIYDDSAYEPKKAVTSLQKFVDVDHVDLVFVWGNEPALAVAPVAEQRKIPTFAIAQYPQVSIGRKYVIRFINNGSDYSKTLLAYLRTQNIKKLAIIKSELSFFNMLVDGLQENADQEKIEVLDALPPTETDFHSNILKLKSKKFDVLGVYLTPPQVGLFFKQSNELDFHPKTFGATPFESKSVMASSWPLMNGAVYTHNAVTEDFRAAYSKRYGTDVQLAYAGNAYDFAILTGKLYLEQKGRPKAEEVLEMYTSSKALNGACGPFHFVSSVEQGNHFEFDIVVRKIRADGTEEIFRNPLGLLGLQ